MLLFVLYWVWIAITHFTCEWSLGHKISVFDVLVNLLFLWSLNVCASTKSSKCDHHCSILNVDIGKQNHKSFILVCFYGTMVRQHNILRYHAFWMTNFSNAQGNSVASYRRISDVRSSNVYLDLFRVNLVSMYFVSTCIAFGGALFLLFHIILLCKGIRSSTVCRKLFGKRKRPITKEQQYDFNDVFGNKWWLWLVPN